MVASPEITWLTERYPQWAPLLSKPGIAEVLLWAEKSSMSKTQVEQAIRDTAYWKSTTEAARAWDVLSATDPAEASKRTADANAKLINIQSRLEVTLTDAQIMELVGISVREGWTEQDMYNTVVVKYIAPDATELPGEIGQTMTAVQTAAAEYGVSLTDKGALDWARRMLIGLESQDSLGGYLRNQAKSMFASEDLHAALDRGVTVKQYADPYLAMAAKELDLNPGAMDLRDVKWSKAFDYADPANGRRRAMSLSEWQQTIRTDKGYGFDLTSGAKTQAAQFATALAEKFGAM